MNSYLTPKTSSFYVKTLRNSTLLPAFFAPVSSTGQALKPNIFDASYLPWRLLSFVHDLFRGSLLSPEETS